MVKGFFFVNPDESSESIKAILQSMDHAAAGELIEAERKSRSSIPIIMHVADKWKKKIEALREKLANLKSAKTKIS
jgi:hypothetical protein